MTNKTTSPFFRLLISILTSVSFVVQGVMPSYANPSTFMPVGLKTLSPHPINPLSLKGLRIDPTQPFQLSFIVDAGDQIEDVLTQQKQSMRLVRYFMAALTIPSEDMWVNLSPHEADRIMPDALSVTHLGRDLLAQDYLLKQLSASLMFPEGDTGERFWQQIYNKAFERFGTTDIPVDTFHKVWVTPDRARVYVQDNTAIITDLHLNVMMEEDYLASRFQRAALSNTAENRELEANHLSSSVMREVIIPVLEEEVNTGAHFVPLRQIMDAAVLAEWYKRRLTDSVVAQVYANQRKVQGIDDISAEEKQRIYEEYVATYQQGVFDFIREEHDQFTNTVLPRHYFSGGARVDLSVLEDHHDPQELRQASVFRSTRTFRLDVGVNPIHPSERSDKGMTSEGIYQFGGVGSDGLMRWVYHALQNGEGMSEVERLVARPGNRFYEDFTQRLGEVVRFMAPLDQSLSRMIETPPEDNVYMREAEISFPVDGEMVTETGIEIRVANNNQIGPAKGGVRIVTASMLQRQDDFKNSWAKLLTLNPTKEEVHRFLMIWNLYTAMSLSGEMSLKSGLLNYFLVFSYLNDKGVEIPSELFERFAFRMFGMGGGKGVLFAGNVVKDPEAESERNPLGWVLKDWGYNPEIYTEYLTASLFRHLTEEKRLGYTIDSPAPDINFLPHHVLVALVAHINMMVSMGKEEFFKEIPRAMYERHQDEYDNMYNTLLAHVAYLEDHPEEDVPSNPAPVNIVQRYWQDNLGRGMAFPWRSIVTGASPEYGGLQGREEATGYGVVSTMISWYRMHQEQYRGKTVAVNGFGNVGYFVNYFAIQKGFDVPIFNDYKIALIKKRGFWTLEELEHIKAVEKRFQQSLNRKNPPKLYELWTNPEMNAALAEVIDVGNIDAVLDDDAAVFEAVFASDTDVKVPAAIERTITVQNVHLLPDDPDLIIVEAANGAVTLAAESKMRGKTIPGQIANAMGVFGSGLSLLESLIGYQFSKDEVFALIDGQVDDIAKRYFHRMQLAENKGESMTPGVAGIEEAMYSIARARLWRHIQVHDGDLSKIAADYDREVSVIEDRVQWLELEFELARVQRERDQEMAARAQGLSEEGDPLGGIDMNTSEMTIGVEGDDQGWWDMPVEQVDAAMLGGIEGFVPRFIHMTPINVPMILGLNDEEELLETAAYANKLDNG